MEPVDDVQRSLFQEIHCTGQNSLFSFPVCEKEVVVNAGPIDLTENITASNKVKVSQIAKTEWEEKYYNGNLVSCNSSFVAYIIKGKGDKDDHVRVINHHTSTRALLRGTKKKIIEVCFESYKSNYLACLDSEGSLFVFKVLEEDGIIKANLIFQINRSNFEDSEKQRVIWAPNLIGPMDIHESLIAVSYGNSADVYDVKKILESYKEGSVLDRDVINAGVFGIKDCHSKAITCLALSPDTNVLATCSLDGDVKFWSIAFSNDSKPQSCLHEWEPHDGEPVTYLSFCDNLLGKDDSLPFWRYLITGTSMNSVVKIWGAVKWECLQTIEFTPYTDQNPTSSPCIKVALDISAKFLILADIYRPVLYICHLHSDNEKEKISITSVSEFILKEPLLNFSIYVAKDKKNHIDETDGDEVVNGVDGDLDNCAEDSESKRDRNLITAVTLFAINKRAIQKYSIKFSANTSEILPPPSISTTASSQEDLMSIRDPLSDVDSSDNLSDKHHFQESEKPDETVGASVIYESADSSITAVSAMTLNGNHAEDVVDSALIRSQPSPYNSVMSTADDTHLYSDSFEKATESFNSDFINSVPEPLVNGIATLSVDCNQQVTLTKSCEVTELPVNERSDDAQPAEKDAVAIESSHVSTDQLLMLLNNQQQELKEMKDLMKQLLSNQKDNMANCIESSENERDDIKVSMQLLQKSATSHFSKATKEFNRLCSEKLEKFSSSLNSQAQQKEERNLQVLSNIVSNTIAIKLEKTIKQEMKHTVLTSLDKLTSEYMERINNQIAQKLSVWERTLIEETRELIKSKPLADSIGAAAGSVLQGALPKAFTECMKNILLPGFEKTLMAIFMQIDQTFRQGTKQHMEAFSKLLDDKKEKQEDSQDPLILHLQDLIQSFQATADRLTSGVETNLEALMQKQLCDALDRMQNSFTTSIESRVVPALTQSISTSISEAMEGKMNVALANIFQSASFNSFPDSAEKSSDDRKAKIVAHVEKGEYNKAFEEALTAADLSLVMFLCKQVDPSELFRQSTCPFRQPIILSLIQQLSVNLAEDTETKRRYLEESIIALDTDDEITREHLPAVLQGLNDQLKQAIDLLLLTDSNNVELKPLRMLLMASRSLHHGV